MQTAMDEIGLDWIVGLRNGDVSQTDKQRQKMKKSLSSEDLISCIERMKQTIRQ